uniref:Biopterin-dependent aromatic amino acid hydroxylase family profile domain-containing protein n=1 Tax=Panagrolaimus sp. PS1159 TaxID=55785 RepID=A0AC35FC23_9BILA
MAGGLKFLYYSQNQKPPATRTLSSRTEQPVEEFKKRFRRSGSVGLPFFPEEDLRSLRGLQSQQTIDETDEDGVKTISVIVRTINVNNAFRRILGAIPENAKIKHVESRDPKSKAKNEIEVFLELEVEEETVPIVEKISNAGFTAIELNRTYTPKGALEVSDPGSADALSGSVWFPKSIYDLDICCRRVIMYGAGLDADHPGFKDEEYRKRRLMFADIALNYKQGEPIPRVQYTEKETATWGVIYRKLRELHQKHACAEYLENFELLEQHCGYSEKNVPQLEDISNFLKMKTGFRLRPVAGYLSARDFLAGLAFRVFNCTQYVRHHADPFYTPEPDTVHELMGHMALFADPDFAQFSQEIGLASLGTSDEDLSKLATLYFFSIEFGMCCVGNDQKTNKPKYKIYGAGLLSSAGELQHAVGGKAEIVRFDPDRVVQQECLITTFQDSYFYTKNFDEAQQKLRLVFL